MNEEQWMQYEQRVLDEYFACRTNIALAGYVREHKTTQDIQDDLSSVMEIPEGTIVSYLMEHNIAIASTADGRLEWKLYRRLEDDSEADDRFDNCNF